MAATAKAVSSNGRKAAEADPLLHTHEIIVGLTTADPRLCTGHVSEYVHVKVPKELAKFLKSVAVACDMQGSKRPVERRGDKHVKGLADTVVYVLDRVYQAHIQQQ